MNVSTAWEPATNHSLRSRLILGITVTTLTVMLITTAIVYSLIRQNLYAQFDALLGAKARTLATMIEQDGKRIDVEFAEHQLQEFARGVRPEYFQVWHADGTVLARSRRLTGTDLPSVSGSRIAPGVMSVSLPDGRPGRVAGIQFLPRVEGERLSTASHLPEQNDLDDTAEKDDVDFSRRTPVTLVVARETAETDKVLARILGILCGSVAVAVGVIVGVLAWLVSRSLQPVEELSEQISRMGEESLTDRIAVADAPRELQPAIARLNALIGRLEVAFLREKKLTADMAHELRTPLAGIRSTLEVAMSHERDGSEYREAMQRSLRICRETEQVVGTLLMLARIEAGNEEIDTGWIDIGHVLQDSWQLYADRAENRKLDVTWHCDPRLILQTAPTMFRVVLANLFDNAVTYSNPGGGIEIESGLHDEHYRLCISNSGCQLSESDADAVFERFWRSDVSRSATGLHTGLGLALCRRILNVLQGSIGVSVDQGRFAVTVAFHRKLIEITATDESEDKPAGKMSVLSSMPA